MQNKVFGCAMYLVFAAALVTATSLSAQKLAGPAEIAAAAKPDMDDICGSTLSFTRCIPEASVTRTGTGRAT